MLCILTDDTIKNITSMAIKATNSKGLRIINCSFSGFETDIELDNVEDFLSQNNRFSRENTPQILLDRLIRSIEKSELSPKEKKQLFQQIINLLSQGKYIQNSKKRKLIDKIGNYVGDKAVDYFVRLASAVSAGLILRQL